MTMANSSPARELLAFYVEAGADLWRLGLDATDGQTDAWQAAQSIMRYVHREFRYQPAVTHAHTHMREVLQSRAGVCQDLAHIMIALGRRIGIPCRYVSGYLETLPPPGKTRLVGADLARARDCLR